MSPELNTTDLQQQADEIAQQLEETEQQQAQQSQSTDWTSGVDVIEIGADILDFLGDVFSNIDIQNEEQLNDYKLKTKPIRNSYIFSGYIIDLESPTKVTQSYDLTPFLKKQLEKDNADQLSTPLEEISTEFDLHQYHFKVYFSEIINNKVNKKDNISVRDMIILVKKK